MAGSWGCWLGIGWAGLGWGGGNGLRQVGSSGGKGGGVGTKGLGRFWSKRACQGVVTVHVAVDTVREGLLL